MQCIINFGISENYFTNSITHSSNFRIYIVISYISNLMETREPFVNTNKCHSWADLRKGGSLRFFFFFSSH